MRYTQQFTLFATTALATLVNGAPVESNNNDKHQRIRLELDANQVAIIDETQEITTISVKEIKSESSIPRKQKKFSSEDHKSFAIDMSDFDEDENLNIPTTTYDPYNDTYYPSQIYSAPSNEIIIPSSITASAFQKPKDEVVLGVFAPNAGWQAPLIPSGNFASILQSHGQQPFYEGEGVSEHPMNIKEFIEPNIKATSADQLTSHTSHTAETRMRAARIFGIPLDHLADGDASKSMEKRDASKEETNHLESREISSQKGDSISIEERQKEQIIAEDIKRASLKSLRKRRLQAGEDNDNNADVLYIVLPKESKPEPESRPEFALEIVQPGVSSNVDDDDLDRLSFLSFDDAEYSEHLKSSSDSSSSVLRLDDIHSPKSNSVVFLTPPSSPTLKDDSDADVFHFVKRSKGDDLESFAPQVKLEKRLKYGSNAFNASLIGNGAGMKSHGHTIHDNTNGAFTPSASVPALYTSLALAGAVIFWSTFM